MGHRQQRLTRPLVHDVRRTHHQSRVGLCASVDVHRTQRHEGLSRSTFRDNPRGARFLQVLRKASDCESLRRQWSAKKRLKRRGSCVFRRLQSRVGLNDAAPQLMGHGAQVVEVCFHGRIS